jgi:hypothetical protein
MRHPSSDKETLQAWKAAAPHVAPRSCAAHAQAPPQLQGLLPWQARTPARHAAGRSRPAAAHPDPPHPGAAQVAAFLAGLHHSRKFRPSVVVCPATVLRQWLRELRCWYPPFRVAVLHDSQRAGHLPRPPRECAPPSPSAPHGLCLCTAYLALISHWSSCSACGKLRMTAHSRPRKLCEVFMPWRF